MSYKLIRLLKRPLVQQQINPLASRKLARSTLLLPPHGSPTFFGDGMTGGEFKEFVMMKMSRHKRRL